NFVCAIKGCQKEILEKQPYLYCWLCDAVVHAKCADVSGRVTDVCTDLHYCCLACREVKKEMKAFMCQTRSGFKELMVKFREAHDLFSALDTQFNSLKLLNESPKRKKSTAGRQQLCQSQRPAIWHTPSPQPPSVTLPLTPQTSIIKNTQGQIKLGLSAVVGNLALPKTLTAVPPSKTIFVSRLAPDLASEDVLAYIHLKTQAENKEVEKFKFSYARDISSFNISVPLKFFDTICSGDFWPEHVLVKEY
ncbi:hypothetical protein KR054_000171, partial [Drosophila jambulina]